jgi:acid stress-induced BolA-like protein IbaG/YrbA
MTQDQVAEKIKAQIPDASIQFDGSDCMFGVTVVSSAFAGKALLARHRMVNACVKEEIANGQLHALSIKALTPEEL